MKAKSGGGITMNKNVSPGIRTGSPNKATSPGAADQIGQTVAFKREQCDIGQAHNASQLGNAKALDVGKGGPGAGRTVMRSGSKSMYGPPNRGESPRGEPRGF
jgi:hypothetical protein